MSVPEAGSSPEPLPAPSHAALPPSNDQPKPRIWRRRIVRAACAFYLGLATWLSLWVARLAADAGAPMTACFPEGSVAFLHVRDADAAWRELETFRPAAELWNDPDFRLWALTAFELHSLDGERQGPLAKWERDRAEWRNAPGFARRLVPVFMEDYDPEAGDPSLLAPFHRQGIFSFLEGELAFSLQAPLEKGNNKDWPSLVFFRLRGGRGALARIVLALAAKPQQRERLHDLGGGLLCLANKGAKPVPQRRRNEAHAPASDAVARIVLRPREVLGRFPMDLPGALKGIPPLQRVFELEAAPDEIRCDVRAPGDGRLLFDGAWDGALPPARPPAPLLEVGLPSGAEPLLEAEFPFDGGAWYPRFLESKLNPNRPWNASSRDIRRWTNRTLELQEAGVNLASDLWPRVGKRFRAAIVPPANGQQMARLLISLPFEADDSARAALWHFARVNWQEVVDGRAAPQQEDLKQYVCRFIDGETERYVLRKKNPPTLFWAVAPHAILAISDAGPLAPAFGAPELKVPPPDAAPSGPRPVAFLRADLARLAPEVSYLVQSELEDQRDEIGAAEYMDAYPYETEMLRLARKLTRFAGHIELELNKVGPQAGAITGSWRPASPLANE